MQPAFANLCLRLQSNKFLIRTRIRSDSHLENKLNIEADYGNRAVCLPGFSAYMTAARGVHFRYAKADELPSTRFFLAVSIFAAEIGFFWLVATNYD